MNGRRRGPRGVVTIELALLLLFIILLLPPVLFFGHVYWRYNVLQQAGHNAARYLSAVPLVDMTDNNASAAALLTARALAAAPSVAVGLAPTANSLVLTCDSCGYVLAPPTMVGVKLKAEVVDDIFYDISQEWLPAPTLFITSDLRVPYAN